MTKRTAELVHELVMRLGAARGWTSHAEIHRQTGVAASTLSRWKQGGGGRTDWFARFEEAYPLPKGTLLDVYEGRRTPDEIVAVYTDEPVDFRSGTGTLTHNPRAELDRVDADAQRMVHDVLRNADFDVSIAANHLPHNLYVNIDGHDVLVDVRVAVPHEEQDQLSLVGLAYEASDPLVFVALIDWPDELVERVEKAGAIYATPADVVDKLTAIGAP